MEPVKAEVVQLFEMNKYTCHKCDLEKLSSDFPIDSHRKNGIRTTCKKCHRVYANKTLKNWRAKNLEKMRPYYHAVDLKRNFNLTKEKYNEMLAGQSGSCAICKTGQENLRKRLSVDHNHFNGKIRGLLCNNCNSGIGFFQENSIALKNAAEYLELWRREHG